MAGLNELVDLCGLECSWQQARLLEFHQTGAHGLDFADVMEERFVGTSGRERPGLVAVRGANWKLASPPVELAEGVHRGKDGVDRRLRPARLLFLKSNHATVSAPEPRDEPC